MEQAAILAIIVIALALFAFELVRPDLVAIGVTCVLVIGGFVTISEGFSGFSNPAVITVVAMFILSSGLVRTGVADHVADVILKFGSTNPIFLTVATMLSVGLMSALMNNIGAVAVLLPAIFTIAQKSKYPAAKLLMPLAFGSLLGGLMTIIGTPPNLLVSIAIEEHGFRGFKLLDFAPTGLAVMTTGVVYMAFIGRRLIPVRGAESDLTDLYDLKDYLTELVVPEDSPLDGVAVRESKIREDFGLEILRVSRKSGEREISFVPSPDTVLQSGDRLIAEGDLSELMRKKDGGILQIHAERKLGDAELTDEEVQVAEVVVAPNSRLVGRSIKEIDVRRRFGVLVLALKRRAHTIQRNFISVPLESADVLLVQGSRETLALMARQPDFVVFKSLEHEPRLRKKAPLTLGIMALVIAGAASGLLHISVAAIAGVLLMGVTGCVRIQEMYEAVDWRVVFLIACMMPLGIAMDSDHTGTAQWLAQGVVGWAGGYGPLVVLGSLFIFTTLITSVMSNAAAAVLLSPIAIAVSNGLGLEPYPFVMTIAIAASSAFLTPVGHQVNVLVYGAGNYRFADFARVGAPLSLLIFIVTMLVVPLVWKFAPLATQ